jgi:hypothetical protein
VTFGDTAEPANQQKPLDADSQSASSRPSVIRPKGTPTRYWTKEFWLALVGIGATVLSGIAAQIFTYQSTRDLSSEEFQRTERRNAYVELNGKAKNLEDAEVQVNTQDFRTRPDFDLADPAATEKAKRRLEEINRRVDETTKEDAARSQFISAAAEVDLVGSGKALIAMFKLREAHSDVEFAYNDIVKANLDWTLAPNKDDPKKLQKVDEAINTYDEKRVATSTARSNFVNAARDDLGIGYDLQWSDKAIAERQRILWKTIAGLVITVLGAIVTRGRWLSVVFLASSIFFLRDLLLFYDLTTCWIVVSAVSAGCAPFVAYRLWRNNGLPAIVERLATWWTNRCEAKQAVAARGESGSDRPT